MELQDIHHSVFEYSSENQVFEPESATSLFEELEEALGSLPDYAMAYSGFNRVFHRSIEQKISATKLHFSGTFAKTDYLLKEYLASPELYRDVNDTRNRLRRKHDLPLEDMKSNCLHDFGHLCRFISLIYGVGIPQTLLSRIPTTVRKHEVRTLLGECSRVIVDHWDERYVYVRSEESDGETLKVCYVDHNAKNSYNHGDWAYLRDLFQKDAQMNLVRPRMEAGVVYPELFILEPDYLVDISAVARCFTSYAESPLVHLVKRIEPDEPSEAILLGNLAGQMLDESVHQLPHTYSYAKSATEFFRHNALDLLAANPGASFHQDAQVQKQNIQNAVNITLPHDLGRFDPKDGLVEPSFFSEMLGLQGRMDYLQLDYKVLLEQKAGKGEWPYDHFIYPRQKEEHYVQLLLYMTLIRYNYRKDYEKNHRELHAFLLYSKYRESLLGLGFAPELIYRALKIRNGIARADLLYAQPSGYRLLESLTPDDLNTKGVNDKLWNDYSRSQLVRLLSPISSASSLEKAYYFRFLTFIANEHVMSKLGNKTKENSGFASTWHDTLEDKRLAGNIYDRLRLLSPGAATEGVVSEVRLGFSETPENDMSNFRAGDIVILYPYQKGSEPDARKTMVFRCTIRSIDADQICLSLMAAQTDNRVFVRYAQSLWAIEHDFRESSFQSLYRGMHAFLSAPKERRDLILTQREPKTCEEVSLKGDYGDFNELALRVKQARELFLIIGPPGTGKTSYGMLYTVKEELLEPDSSVVVMSYTNRAVDEICGKLVQENIGFIRMGNESNCGEAYRPYLLSTKVRECRNVADFRDMVMRTRVFVGTTTAFNSKMSFFQLKSFSLAVIDEASQILEPHIIGLLSAQKDGVSSIRKVVMIGDHKQLPAVVQQGQDVSVVRDTSLNGIALYDCRQSLFERLLNRYGADNKKVAYMLTRQGRMHHDIAVFPNVVFYGNRLTEVPLPHQCGNLPDRCKGKNGIVDLLTTRRIAFISVGAPDLSPSDKVNQHEADIIAATVASIYELERQHFDADETVGVIVPYRNQISAVRNTLETYGISQLRRITIDTVERFQGSQRKYIVYGFTVQRYYQLRFLTGNVFVDSDGSVVDRKLNVAMTRAKEHLIMVGNADILVNNFTYMKLMEFVKSKHGYFEVTPEDYVSGRFTVPDIPSQDFDWSQAVLDCSSRFERVFAQHVTRPIAEDASTTLPSRLFGHDMTFNLNAIGYGRVNFTHAVRFCDNLSPRRQALLYAYYYMRHYYRGSLSAYHSIGKWMNGLMASVGGRVQVIDIGCGPATCGTAFSEVFLHDAPGMVYTGIDVSVAMREIGQEILADHSRLMNVQMKAAFGQLGEEFWEGCSALPSLVVFNAAYFFGSVSQKTSEELASQIVDVMRRYPLNKYVFIILQSECDCGLESFKVFRRSLSPYVSVYSQGMMSYDYMLDDKVGKATLNCLVWGVTS